jgi:hypothetical protein
MVNGQGYFDQRAHPSRLFLGVNGPELKPAAVTAGFVFWYTRGMAAVVWRAKIERDQFGRFVLVNYDYEALAWSGSAWTPHHHGLPTGRVQVSNFDTWDAARLAGQEAGLSVVSYTLDEDKLSITCLRCKRTSHNPEDVEQRYCGQCHIFMDGE